MSDQTLDTRVESLLREALKAEAASLPLRVTSDHVLDRARVRGGTRAGSRQAHARLSMAFAAGAAAVVIAIAGAGGLNFIVNQGIGGPVASPTARPALTAPQFGLAGNGVIALAKDGDIFVADRPGGDLRPLVAGPEDDRSPMFSPDGTRLAFLRDTGQGSFLMVADPDGTNVVAIPLESRDLEYWSFAPDGRSLMAVGSIGGEERVFIRPVDPRAAPTVLDVQLLNPSMLRSWAIPTFNPTNPQEILVVGQLEPDGPRGLHVYDLATGGIRTIVEPADEQFQDIAWLPDGEHIIYRVGLDPRVVAADGSGDRAFDALRGRFSPLSNDGTRVVAERGGEGVQTPRPPEIVPINGEDEHVVLACGPGTDIECPSPPTDWIWSPDDSMLIGTVYHETSSGGLAETYLLVDTRTGQVTELDWVDVGTPAWQRVAP